MRRGVKVVAKEWHQQVPAILVVDREEGEYRKDAVLPFLPRAGDELGVGPRGDYIKVETVYWCAEDGLTVWFVDKPETHCLVADGWRLQT